jgi:hypothetical protein
MKKIAPIAALALFAMAFTSCKKDYTCECTYPSKPELNTSGQTGKMSKKDAQAKCDALDAVVKAAPIAGRCALK